MNTKKIPVDGYSADLDERLRLAGGFVADLRDESRGGRPYFGVNRSGGELVARAGSMTIDMPHVTGRALDILFNIEDSLGEKTDPQVLKDYEYWFWECMDGDLNAQLYTDWTTGKRYLETHNMRQTAEALAHLVRAGDKRALKCTAGFINTLVGITDIKTGLFSDACADRNFPAGVREKINGSLNHPRCLSTGRLGEPLLKIYDETGDGRALDLAVAYAKSADAAFDENGVPYVPVSGDHVHSITSTLSSMLAVALRTGDDHLIGRVRKIYEDGFASKDYMTDYGWVKEQIELVTDTGHGEVNQVGDMIQVQLGLAGIENPALWYSRAEKFIRGGVLPTQIRIFPDTPNYPFKPNDEKRDMLNRAAGGWGFPSPTSYLVLEGGGLETIDIAQGAVQALCAAKEKIVTSDGEALAVNLLFSTDNTLARVESSLPYRGELSVTPKSDAELRIRIPEGTPEDRIAVSSAKGVLPVSLRDGYALIGRVKAGERITISFTPAQKTVKEEINTVMSEVSWYGEQVTEVTPKRGFFDLYGSFTPAK